ncbi:MAG: galactokinase, partial [Oscillospiraceae bacterium]|nr:galactokinase [Oscillospiraceae bacterium]
MKFTVPGRTELAGNHTDHQGGHVLAAAINVFMSAEAEKTDGNTAVIRSRGFGDFSVELDLAGPRQSEKGRPEALVRGTAERLAAQGRRIGAFKAEIESDIAVGSGLSSSAAFEVLIGSIISGLFNDGAISPGELAAAGKYAENEYFGKPCGMMDQCACAYRGIVAIDFGNEDSPEVTRINADFGRAGYCLVLTDTGGSHSGLTPYYAAITREMGSVAAIFGQKTLSRVDRGDFYSVLGELRAAVGDRAVLRAMHWFDEDKRVLRMTEALSAGDMKSYVELMDASGRSSAELLQNSYADPSSQGISLALARSREILGKNGAARVHGGGFAGTVQALVPVDMAGRYVSALEEIFGKGSCRKV